jgi:hypothetical protein
MPDKRSAHAFLAQWCAEVNAAKIPAFQTFAKTVIAHWNGIVLRRIPVDQWYSRGHQ